MIRPFITELNATPPAMSAVQKKDPIASTAAELAPAIAKQKLPALGAKLGASVAALRALGGPAFEEIAELAHGTETETIPPIQILGRAHDGIQEIHEWFAAQPPRAT